MFPRNWPCSFYNQQSQLFIQFKINQISLHGRTSLLDSVECSKFLKLRNLFLDIVNNQDFDEFSLLQLLGYSPCMDRSHVVNEFDLV